MSIATSTAISLGVAAGTAGADFLAAHESAGAANTATAAQSAANDKALAFNERQAEITFQESQQTAKANYDQWAASRVAKNAFAASMGLPTTTIPPFQPLTDPNFTAAGGPAPSGQPAASSPSPAPQSVGTYLQAPPSSSPSSAAQPTTVNGQSPQAYAQGLLSKGMPPQQVTAMVSQLFQLPLAQAARYVPGNNMMPQSVGAYLAPPQPMAPLANPTAPFASAASVPAWQPGPRPYQPQSINDYLMNGGGA